MKKVLASLVLLTGSVSMAIGQLNIDARVDHVSYSPNDAVQKPGYEVFQVTRMKLDYQGKLGDLNSFRFRIDPLQNTAVTATRDKTSKFLDIAWVSHKFTDEISLTMGKVVAGLGGIEGYVNVPADIYLTSVAGAEVGAIYYPVGAQADMTFATDHRVRLTFGNNTTDVTNTANGGAASLNNTRGLSSLSYLGKFLENNLTATASYAMEDYTTSAGAAKVKNSFTSVGAKYVMDPMEFELDYLSNKYDLDPQANNNILSTISTVGLVRYKIADIGSFHVKYEATEQKTATSATTDKKDTITGITGAFEYKPVKDENWRMHVAYTQKDSKPETGDTKTEKIVYAGMRLYMDMLK